MAPAAAHHVVPRTPILMVETSAVLIAIKMQQSMDLSWTRQCKRVVQNEHCQHVLLVRVHIATITVQQMERAPQQTVPRDKPVRPQQQIIICQMVFQKPVLRTVLRIHHLRVGIFHIRPVMVHLLKQVPRMTVPHQQTVLLTPVHRVHLERVHTVNTPVAQLKMTVPRQVVISPWHLLHARLTSIKMALRVNLALHHIHILTQVQPV